MYFPAKFSSCMLCFFTLSVFLSPPIQMKEIRGVVATERVDRQQLLGHLKSMQDAFLTSVFTPPLSLSSLSYTFLFFIYPLPLSISPRSRLAVEGPEISGDQRNVCNSGLRVDGHGGGVCWCGRKHADSAHSSSS